MLESASDHDFHDLQFGFVEARGTCMAICTTTDTIAYVNSMGSSVYACILDAEKAVDGFPHCILLRKRQGIISWFLLYGIEA